MPDYTICTYNVQHMNNMFELGAVKQNYVDRAEVIATVIKRIDPHVLALSEAANADEEHQYFIDHFLDGRWSVVSGRSRGRQNLVYYIREPFQEVSVDDADNYYDPWDSDVDNDSVTEHFRWERKPLEAVFRIGNTPDAERIRFINVHAKSKGIFDVVDLARFDTISMGNRKKLIAQATRLRQRLNALRTGPDALPVVVLGDMNDGPGLDPYERKLGKSFVETVMGSVFHPDQIFHNALLHIPADDRWTADFQDPIVSHPFGFSHRVWIDHILVSPDLADSGSPFRLLPESGTIDSRDSVAREASDHFAVSCVLSDD